MKISVDHGFLFVHIPRTAGSSIAGSLSPFCIPERRQYPRKALAKIGLARSWTDLDYRIHLPLAAARRRIPRTIFDSMSKFTVVRNPWDWMVSRFHHRRQRLSGGRHRRRKRHVDCFADFIRWQASQVHVKPEATQLGMISTPGRKIGVDRILRFENLKEDWADLMEQLGIHAGLPHWNRSQHGDWRTLYGTEEASLVAANWADDIEALGYAFDD